MESGDESILEPTQKIYRLYHNDVNVNEAVELMQNQGISPDLVKSIYDQLLTDAEKMTERFHYYNAEVNRNANFYRVICWTSRYMIAYDSISSDSNFYEFKMIDLFNDKSIKITFEKSAKRFAIHHLKDGFGLLEEYENGTPFISLIFLDIRGRSLQKIFRLEYTFYLSKIIVNKANPSMFLLNDPNIGVSQTYKFTKNAIIIDAVDIDFCPQCFYDKFVYALDWSDEDEDDQGLCIPQLCIYDVEKKTEKRFELEIPVGYTFNNAGSLECVPGKLFLQLKDGNGMHVIGCLDMKTRQLNVLDFSSKLRIYNITGFGEGSLIVQTQTNNFQMDHFYKIPFGKPESLEEIAWLSLVKAMKKRDTIEDPYEAARKYLPPNSDINCVFELE